MRKQEREREKKQRFKVEGATVVKTFALSAGDVLKQPMDWRKESRHLGLVRPGPVHRVGGEREPVTAADC